MQEEILETTLEDNEEILDVEINAIQKDVELDHSKLDNLDFENSGHTGFAPAGDYIEDVNYVHTDNNYTDTEKTKLAGLSNYDDTEIKRDISNLQTNKADKTEIPDVSNFITKNVNDLTYYTLATSTGSTIELSINSSTYVMTLNLKNSAGTTISTGTVDLPLESVVINGSYDSTNKKIILTLQSGSTIEFSVADLVSGLQSEITSNNKLNADLVDDNNSTNKFFSGNYNDLSNKPTIPDELADLSDDSTHRLVTDTEKTTWNDKYDKPSEGIPSTDLSSAVQTSLGKADTALQTETYTGTITSVKMNGTTISSSGEADLGTVITSHQDISGKEDKANKVTSISSSSTDTEYPSALAVYTATSSKQDTLTFDSTPTQNSTNPVTSDGIYQALQNAGGGSDGKIKILGTTNDFNTQTKALDLMTLKNGIYLINTSYYNGNRLQQTSRTFYIKVTTPDGVKYGSIGLSGDVYSNYYNEAVIFVVDNEINSSADFSTSTYRRIGRMWYQTRNNNTAGFYNRLIRANNSNVSTSEEGSTFSYSNYVSTNNVQTISGKKTFSTLPESSVTPTTDNQLTRKGYVDSLLTTYSGYDATKTQVLKNVNGTLTWIDE